MDYRFFAALPFLGLLAFLGGLAHLSPRVAASDQRVFLLLNQLFNKQRLVEFFRLIWPLGTTPFALALLTINFLNGWRIGFIVSGIYAASIITERIVKLAIKRPRPFNSLPEIVMQQPRRPKDPSFPSGDALRVWFLALVIPAAFGLTWLAFTIAMLMALLVSIGRLALGVHYPLDVLGGTGLGILFAGINLILIPGILQ